MRKWSKGVEEGKWNQPYTSETLDLDWPVGENVHLRDKSRNKQMNKFLNIDCDKMWGILHGSFVCDALALQLRWTPGHRSHTWTENEKNIKTMQKVQNGNYFQPMRPTLKTLLLMESKQLLCVELLSTAATHIDLRMRVGLRNMVKEHWYKKAHPTSPNDTFWKLCFVWVRLTWHNIQMRKNLMGESMYGEALLVIAILQINFRSIFSTKYYSLYV